MTRSHWKGPFVDGFLIRKIARAPDKRSPFKVWTRRSLIIPQFVGKLLARLDDFEAHLNASMEDLVEAEVRAGRDTVRFI